MKRILLTTTVFLAVPVLFGCAGTSSSMSSNSDRVIINNYEVNVEHPLEIEPIFTGTVEPVTYAYEGDDIRIDNGFIYGLLSNTTTEVTATTSSNLTTTFSVTVEEDNYVSTVAAEASEGWLNPITVDPIAALANNETFPLGIDISMVKQIYDQGGQFYNDEGHAESVYRILKEHGVNYIRLRLWNDPYNHIDDTLVPYGGGICDLATDIAMAKGAKDAGLKLLLDFHFSDFWADPGKQVIPKAWKDLTSSVAVASALQAYVTETLTAFQEAGALPDMVQLGNETTSGLFTTYPGGTNDHLTGDNPYYISQRTSISSVISGPNGSANLVTYMSAALDGVHAVSEDILTMIHIAKGMTGTAFIANYYHQFDALDYDIIGLSGYSYYHFPGGLTTLHDCLSFVSNEFPTKKITIAETAYAFTYAADANASNIFSRTNETVSALSGYDVTVQGQADLIRDITNEVASIPNGFGVFYWEGAWLPVAGAGWADLNSKCSWANQSFFTYDGKALPSLDLYTGIKG